MVETRNFTDNGTGTFGLPGLIDRNMVLVERFTRVDDRLLTYRFTISDPTVWLTPWSAEVPMTRIDGFVMDTPVTRATTASPTFWRARAKERASSGKP